ncbi:uncharacterized protein LOC124280640 [Haliotis rubra]|uniref:uncharacterized protein LOC124280640 n=1 Tax=Haliotis rubra TaxID=36100 RepID=UPI001EE5F841|nr:uncharacterized protein LOC124280640 [Haliotis rubra]
MASGDEDTGGSCTAPKLEDVKRTVVGPADVVSYRDRRRSTVFHSRYPHIGVHQRQPLPTLLLIRNIHRNRGYTDRMFGILTPKEAKATDPARLRCLVITFRVFLSLGIDVGLVHFAYGSGHVSSASPEMAEHVRGNTPFRQQSARRAQYDRRTGHFGAMLSEHYRRLAAIRYSGKNGKVEDD